MKPKMINGGPLFMVSFFFFFFFWGGGGGGGGYSFRDPDHPRRSKTTSGVALELYPL